MKTVNIFAKKLTRLENESDFDWYSRQADWYFGKAAWIDKYVQIPLTVIMAICVIGIIICLILR